MMTKSSSLSSTKLSSQGETVSKTINLTPEDLAAADKAREILKAVDMKSKIDRDRISGSDLDRLDCV
jgi:hypothetical protein